MNKFSHIKEARLLFFAETNEKPQPIEQQRTDKLNKLDEKHKAFEAAAEKLLKDLDEVGLTSQSAPSKALQEKLAKLRLNVIMQKEAVLRGEKVTAEKITQCSEEAMKAIYVAQEAYRTEAEKRENPYNFRDTPPPNPVYQYARMFTVDPGENVQTLMKNYPIPVVLNSNKISAQTMDYYVARKSVMIDGKPKMVYTVASREPFQVNVGGVQWMIENVKKPTPAPVNATFVNVSTQVQLNMAASELAAASSVASNPAAAPTPSPNIVPPTVPTEVPVQIPVTPTEGSGGGIDIRKIEKTKELAQRALQLANDGKIDDAYQALEELNTASENFNMRESNVFVFAVPSQPSGAYKMELVGRGIFNKFRLVSDSKTIDPGAETLQDKRERKTRVAFAKADEVVRLMREGKTKEAQAACGELTALYAKMSEDDRTGFILEFGGRGASNPDLYKANSYELTYEGEEADVKFKVEPLKPIPTKSIEQKPETVFLNEAKEVMKLLKNEGFETANARLDELNNSIKQANVSKSRAVFNSLVNDVLSIESASDANNESDVYVFEYTNDLTKPFAFRLIGSPEPMKEKEVVEKKLNGFPATITVGTEVEGTVIPPDAYLTLKYNNDEILYLSRNDAGNVSFRPKNIGTYTISMSDGGPSVTIDVTAPEQAKAIETKPEKTIENAEANKERGINELLKFKSIEPKPTMKDGEGVRYWIPNSEGKGVLYRFMRGRWEVDSPNGWLNQINEFTPVQNPSNELTQKLNTLTQTLLAGNKPESLEETTERTLERVNFYETYNYRYTTFEQQAPQEAFGKALDAMRNELKTQPDNDRSAVLQNRISELEIIDRNLRAREAKKANDAIVPALEEARQRGGEEEKNMAKKVLAGNEKELALLQDCDDSVNAYIGMERGARIDALKRAIAEYQREIEDPIVERREREGRKFLEKYVVDGELKKVTVEGQERWEWNRFLIEKVQFVFERTGNNPHWMYYLGGNKSRSLEGEAAKKWTRSVLATTRDHLVDMNKASFK